MKVKGIVLLDDFLNKNKNHTICSAPTSSLACSKQWGEDPEDRILISSFNHRWRIIVWSSVSCAGYIHSFYTIFIYCLIIYILTLSFSLIWRAMLWNTFVKVWLNSFFQYNIRNQVGKLFDLGYLNICHLEDDQKWISNNIK